jgi:hypothetical protein
MENSQTTQSTQPNQPTSREMLRVLGHSTDGNVIVCEPEDKENELNLYIIYGFGGPTYSCMALKTEDFRDVINFDVD